MIVEYQALNRSGAVVVDSLEVEDDSQVRAELDRRGLTPITISKAKDKEQANWLNNLLQSKLLTKEISANKASKKELSFFTTQMAIMLETGTTVANALGAIGQQVTCPHWQLLVNEIHRHVEEGGTLASGISQYPAFPRMQLNEGGFAYFYFRR